MPSSRPILARLLSVAVGFPLALGTAHAAYNVTIDVGASTGGSWFGNTWSATASGATVAVSEIEDRLASGDVSIDTGVAGSEAGDIAIAVTLAWDANRLTLSATGDILVQAPVTAPSPAGLTLTTGAEGAVLTAYDPAAGFTGRIDLDADDSGALVINGQTYHVVTDADGLFAAVRDGVSPIALGGDVALYVRPETDFIDAGRCNLSLIDTNAELSFCFFDYAGVLNGLGHAVSDLVYRLPSQPYFIYNSGTQIGLFGTLDGAAISNLALSDIRLRVNVDGVGLLAGKLANGAEVTNVHVSGSVENEKGAAGGLVGLSSASTVTDCSAAVTASSGGLRVGGLVGSSDNGTRIIRSQATGSVTGPNQVGGLVGWSRASGIIDSSATGPVLGNISVGGLVGDAGAGASLLRTSASGAVTGAQNLGGLVGTVGTGGATVSQSVATGTVIARADSNARYVGGLLGSGNADTLIHSSYSRSPVSGAVSVAGLVGELVGSADGAIAKSYAAGSVGTFVGADGGPTAVGGLLGAGVADSARASFWDLDTSGQSGSASGTGQSNAAMRQDGTFIAAGWDFNYLWAVTSGENQGYPYFGFRDCGPGIATVVSPTALWQMLSLPCVPPDAVPTVASTLGNDPIANLAAATYGSRWVVNGRNATNSANLRMSGDDALALGTGYWIRTLDAPVDGVLQVLDGTATAVTDSSQDCASDNGCVVVPLSVNSDPVGPKLIGNPLPYDVDWSLVRVRVDGVDVYSPSEAQAADLLANQFWVWNGVAYDTASDTAPNRGDLRYFKSFWAEVLPGAAGSDLELLIPAQSSDAIQASPGAGEWRVRLTAENAANGWRTSVLLGQWTDAETGHDAADLRSMAPYASPYLGLTIPHTDWGADKGDYASDLRPADGFPAQWDLNLRANPSRIALVLSWEGDAAVLARSRLIDGAKVIDLADYPDGYPVNLTGKLRRLRWEYLGSAD